MYMRFRVTEKTILSEYSIYPGNIAYEVSKLRSNQAVIQLCIFLWFEPTCWNSDSFPRKKRWNEWNENKKRDEESYGDCDLDCLLIQPMLSAATNWLVLGFRNVIQTKGLGEKRRSFQFEKNVIRV